MLILARTIIAMYLLSLIYQPSHKDRDEEAQPEIFTRLIGTSLGFNTHLTHPPITLCRRLTCMLNLEKSMPSLLRNP
jgi:hypothetical protein